MPEDLSLAPATATATVHPVDAATSRMVHEQLASGRPDIGLLWELCLRVEFERPALVDGLAAWLGPPAGLRVLDAACGSGFPALDLIRRGYAVTCSDGSPRMLERFRRNAAFDVVLCRGSSLIYAGTWDREDQPSRAVLERSVESLVRCVRPGGRLYVDTTRAEDLAAPSAGSRSELVLADGARVVLQERIETDLDRGVRSWTTVVRSAEGECTFGRRSHHLPHAELVELLGRAGLRGVRPVEVPGERYQVFTGVTDPAGGRGPSG